MTANTCSIADNYIWAPTRITAKSCAAVGGGFKLSIKQRLESIVANSDARADLKSDLRDFGFYSLGISKDRT